MFNPWGAHGLKTVHSHTLPNVTKKKQKKRFRFATKPLYDKEYCQNYQLNKMLLCKWICASKSIVSVILWFSCLYHFGRQYIIQCLSQNKRDSFKLCLLWRYLLTGVELEKAHPTTDNEKPSYCLISDILFKASVEKWMNELRTKSEYWILF